MPPDDRGARTGSTRTVPRLLLGLALVFLVLRVATALYEKSRAPVEPEELVAWRPIADAVTLARQTGKPILYDFTADWCPPCHQMSREVFAEPQAARRIEELFVPVRVLDRTREEGRNAPDVAALQTRYGVEAFPTLVVANPDGGEPVKIEGYPGRDPLLYRLTQARQGPGMRLQFGPGGATVDSVR